MTLTRAALDGLLIGLSVAVFAGSGAIRVLETATRSGLGRGLAGGAGVATADGLWAVGFTALGAAAAGLSRHWDGLWRWVALAALLPLGVAVVRDLLQRRAIPVYTGPRSVTALYRGFLGHALVSVVTAVFFVSLAAGPDPGYRPAEATAFVVGVFVGSMAWQTGLAVIGARRATPLSAAARRRLPWTDCVLLAVFSAYIVFGV